MEPLSRFAARKVNHPVMLQNWSHISFLHWPYGADSIQRLLPPGLTVDLHNSYAWLGLTPFIVGKLRPPFLPSLPWFSQFPETNVRTYVIGPDGSRGIWFFSLEAARSVAVLGARVLYGLPYRWASMSVRKEGDSIAYHSLRRKGRTCVTTDIVVQPGTEIQTTDLETFLTARFRLFSFRKKRLWFADVEHEPWPLREGHIRKIDETLLRSLSLDEPHCNPLCHYSTGVRTRVSRLRLLTDAPSEWRTGKD
jgi:uncharacterized protein YqjF (DUF2071 family)